MDRHEAYKLRDELNRGQRRLGDLSAEDFKGLMYWLLVERFILPAHQFNFSDQFLGEVEIALVELLDQPDGEAGVGHEERTHFFECNEYGRSFDPAVLGKLFCAAIRHQPETLVLVSTRPLYGQALEYANLFFGAEGHFPRVAFQNLRAEFLLDPALDDEDSPEPGTRRGSPSEQTPAQFAKWRLIEHEKFNDRIIASSDAAVLTVRLHGDRRYTLEIRGALRGLVNLGEVEVAISRHGGVRSAHFRSNKPPRVQGHDFLARFTVAPEALAPGGEVAWMLHVHASKSRELSSSLRLPAMDIADDVEAWLPDARSVTSDSVSEVLRDGNGAITFLRGEAGVGKSYLCEQVASDLKFRYGYQVENFRAESAEGLFLRVLLRLLTPRFHEGSENSSAFEKQVIRAALRCLLHEFAPTEIESLSEAITERDSARAAPEKIVPLLASLLAQSGDILLIIQDCHELPSTLTAPLAALIVALDERGWAGTRMILEYRTGPGTENLAWTEFVERVNSTLHSRTQTLHLQTFNQDETGNFLRPLFEAINEALIAAFWSRTGGNPLLLVSLLRSLVKTGAVGRPTGAENDRFRVLHPAQILEGRHRMDEGPQQILKNRVRLLDAARPPGFDALPSVIPVLAILALTEDLLPRDGVFQYFGLSPADGARLVRWLTREEILSGSGDSSGVAGFTHDLIRDTVVKLGKEDPLTLSIAERIADEVAPEGYLALLRRAQLARYIGDERLCREHLDRGQEAARYENRFHWARRFQQELLDLLRSLKSPTVRDRLAQLTLLNNLGWSEHNAGSNRVAREYFREARGLAEWLPMGTGDWTPQLRRATLAKLDHQTMMVDLILLDFEAFLASASRALERVNDPTLLNDITNRLILGCSVLGFVEEGMYFTRAGIELASTSKDPEVNAVLCTDISAFLSPGLPGEAVRLAEQGIYLAHSARQRAHNEYSSMAHRLWAHGQVDPPARREEFQGQLRELGMAILEGSLSTFEGVVELISGNTAEARVLFAQAEIHARLYDQTDLEPALWNNAMVAALLHGDMDSAAAFSDRLIRFWTRLAEQRRRVAPHWGSLISAFEAARSRISAPSGATTLSLPPAPPFAGEFLASLVNLVSLHQAGWRAGGAAPELGALLAEWVGSAYPRLSGSPSMIVEWKGVPLYLDP